MKNLLIITHNQFGYQVSSYYYTKYLGNEYNIDYICFDESKKKINSATASVHYFKKHKNLIKAYLGLISLSIGFIYRNKPQKIIIKYFPGCYFIPIITFRKIILDIRTASVSDSFILNFINDIVLRIGCVFFHKIIILSESLKKRLFIPSAIVITLGAEPKGYSLKSFKNLKLLYIGSLNNRNIDKTIVGSKYFIDQYPQIKFEYTIIGSGAPKYIKQLVKTIEDTKLTDKVIILGYIPHIQLEHYFLNNNIGVSFIPMTRYYDMQPPSKTYEYLMAGMPVLATDTYENKRIVSNANGILIEDTSESFAEGLEKIWTKRNEWNSNRIAETVSDYKWEVIINKNLKPILNK